MNHYYADIIEKLGAPKWWDEYAVPRYCDFAPNEAAYIYARQIALTQIECQGCRKSFAVAMSTGSMAGTQLSELIAAGELHYGDPPNANCCAAGPTMNSIPRRVVQFWMRDIREWKRAPEFERVLDCEWA